MIARRHPAALLGLVLLSLTPVAAHAQALIDQCTAQTCKARLTAPELLGEVQKLVAEHRYGEATPMIAALRGAPGMAFEWRFLTGYVASQTGDLPRAIAMYQAILTDDPGQTRVRLELAKALFQLGRAESADRQFKIAQQDRDLPPEVARTIRTVRDVIRTKRAWTFNVDVGIAPDSNINNATAADTVTVMFGPIPIPLTLDENARARSGTGRTGSIDAGLRLPLGGDVSLLADLDAAGTDYAGRTFDDLYTEAALGPQIALDETTRVSFQGVVSQRNFGGLIATRQWGAKAGFETALGDSARLGVQLDARRTSARFDGAYDGWQTGVYATYERAVAKAVVASAGLFARRDFLAARPYSNSELGAIAGIGGELPWGFNLGVSGTVSRALFDAPLAIFSLDPRRDWRFNMRATIGNRGLRWMGFSPSVNLSWGRVDSSLGFYASTRTRVRFALARYF